MIRREQWLREQARRYAPQIAANPQVYEDIKNAYDRGMARPGAQHVDGAFEARKGMADLKAERDAQIQLNVQNQAKQLNTARQFGVPRGWVMAHEDVAQSAKSGDLATASAKAAMYSQMYGPGFIHAAQAMTQQQVAANVAEGKKKAEPKGIVDAAADGLARIAQMAPGAARKAAVDIFFDKANDGNPEAKAKAVRDHYQPIIRGLAGRLGNLSPEEMSEFQQVIGNMGYKEFLQYTGLPDSAQVQGQYQKIFGRNATWGQWGTNLWRGLTPWDD